MKEELNKKGVDVSMVKTIEGTTAISHIDLIEKEGCLANMKRAYCPNCI